MEAMLNCLAPHSLLSLLFYSIQVLSMHGTTHSGLSSHKLLIKKMPYKFTYTQSNRGTFTIEIPLSRQHQLLLICQIAIQNNEKTYTGKKISSLTSDTWSSGQVLQHWQQHVCLQGCVCLDSFSQELKGSLPIPIVGGFICQHECLARVLHLPCLHWRITLVKLFLLMYMFQEASVGCQLPLPIPVSSSILTSHSPSHQIFSALLLPFPLLYHCILCSLP